MLRKKAHLERITDSCCKWTVTNISNILIDDSSRKKMRKGKIQDLREREKKDKSTPSKSVGLEK